jgi:hypothetical protein
MWSAQSKNRNNVTSFVYMIMALWEILIKPVQLQLLHV